MAKLKLPLIVLVTVLCGTPRSESANFPLTGCLTDEIDFLFLYSDSRSFGNNGEEHTFASEFAKQVVGSSEMTTRVKFAGVYDVFSVSGSQINVSSWHFNNLQAFIEQQKSDRESEQTHNLIYYNVNEIINTKLQFVERLFSEMGGVRENVTHVAVIFIYGGDLSFDDSKSISDTVQQWTVTDIKIFVVVNGVSYYNQIIVLNDTLLLGDGNIDVHKHILFIAICNQCIEEWFSLERRHNIDYLSCYMLKSYEGEHGYNLASSTCNDHGSVLSTIETQEELVFLQNKISTYLKPVRKQRFGFNESFQSSIEFLFGLQRDQKNLDKRFVWSDSQFPQPRPFIVNHWLPGKPSGDLNRGCVSWRFELNSTGDNVSDTSSKESHYVDGWRDVECKDELISLSLCEFILPLKIDHTSALRIKPATNESFSQALAKGDFLIFRGNIVSVSANIANLEFVEFFKQTKQELFPFFDCGIDAPDPRYVSYIYVCDSVDHCSNGRDEKFCLFEGIAGQINKRMQKKFGVVKCCDGSCLPLQLVGDGDVHCKVCEYSSETELSDESEVIVNSLKANERCALICDDECVNLSKLNDGFTDCTGPEGPLDETIGKLVAADICYSKFGHRIWAPRCVNVKDIYGYLLGCSDMSHLKGCIDFECPDGYFKCPNTYCIPQHYVFDGSTDCPSGEDENELIIYSCTGNFACWNSKICLHPDTVCDGHPDCPYQDDEVDCHTQCHKNLRCKAGTVTIVRFNLPINTLILQQRFDKTFRYLDLSGFNLSEWDLFQFQFMLEFPKLTVLKLSNCNINTLRYQFSFYSSGLQELDLSYNDLQTLHMSNLYHPLPENIRYLNLSFNKELVEMINFKLNFLLTLDLSHTSLSNFDKSFFSWFPNLRNLNLSFTKISNIHRNTFPHNSFLQTLDLRGITIGDFNNDFFNGLTIYQNLYSDSYESCCPMIRGRNIPDYSCHAPDNVISSCFDLIGVNVQRIFLWVFAVLAILGNVTVIGYRVIWDRSILRTGYGLFVTNLGISDFIMGVYLFIIAGADYYYRDIYVFYDKIWRQSDTCKLAGFLASLSSETSTIFIFFITLDRFLIMKFPFGQVKFTKISKSIVLSLSWIIGFLLALIPIVFRFEINASNAMCLGLPLTTKLISGWEFSFAVFIVLNFCLVLLIAYGQRAIFRDISEKRMALVASRRAGDITVAKQLSLVAMSSFLCWFPIGLMGFLSIGGHVINNEIYAWTTVIILPIKSPANPLLYIIPALQAKWEQFKHG